MQSEVKMCYILSSSNDWKLLLTTMSCYTRKMRRYLQSLHTIITAWNFFIADLFSTVIRKIQQDQCFFCSLWCLHYSNCNSHKLLFPVDTFKVVFKTLYARTHSFLIKFFFFFFSFSHSSKEKIHKIINLYCCYTTGNNDLVHLRYLSSSSKGYSL